MGGTVTFIRYVYLSVTFICPLHFRLLLDFVVHVYEDALVIWIVGKDCGLVKAIFWWFDRRECQIMLQFYWSKSRRFHNSEALSQ